MRERATGGVINLGILEVERARRRTPDRKRADPRFLGRQGVASAINSISTGVELDVDTVELEFS
jgi:hypothetical protein